MFLVLKMVYEYTAALEVLFSFTGDCDIKDVNLCRGHITNYFSTTKMNLYQDILLTEHYIFFYTM